MGWGSGYLDGRLVGYTVVATCDKRGCENVIDRGLGYRCGDLHSDDGCGFYFCGEHLSGIGPRGGCAHRQRQAWGIPLAEPTDAP